MFLESSLYIREKQTNPLSLSVSDWSTHQRGKINIFSNNWFEISSISNENENTLNAVNVPCLIVWHIQIEVSTKSQFFPQLYNLFGTQPNKKTRPNQKFSVSWTKFYGLSWSLTPNWLMDRDWTTKNLLLLHRRATGLTILKTLPNKTMDCRNKGTASITRTSFNLLTAFNYLTEDHQLQVLMVPLLHWRQFSARSAEGGSTLLPKEQMHFALSYPCFTWDTLTSARGRVLKDKLTLSPAAATTYFLLPFFSRGEKNISPGVCWASGHSLNPQPAPLLESQREDQRKWQGAAWELLK